MNYIDKLTNCNLQTLYFYYQTDYPKKRGILETSREQKIFFDLFMFKGGGFSNNYNYMTNMIEIKKQSKKMSNKDASVEFIDDDKRICLFIDKFINKYETKLIYGCKINNYCLSATLNYKTKIAILQTLQKDTRCLYKNGFPNQKDINKMMLHFIDFCKKESMKEIQLTDNSYIVCGENKIKVHLSEIFILKRGKPYYSEKFGFIPEDVGYQLFLDNIKIMKKIKWNSKKIKWKTILNHLSNEKEKNIILQNIENCKNKDCLLTEFIQKLGNKICESWKILIHYLFLQLRLNRMYGITFILPLT